MEANRRNAARVPRFADKKVDHAFGAAKVDLGALQAVNRKRFDKPEKKIARQDTGGAAKMADCYFLEAAKRERRDGKYAAQINNKRFEKVELRDYQNNNIYKKVGVKDERIYVKHDRDMLNRAAHHRHGAAQKRRNFCKEKIYENHEMEYKKIIVEGIMCEKIIEKREVIYVAGN